MLAGDADRERTADVLKAAFAEGRLYKQEYDHRLSRIMAARTVEELRHLVSDLPNGPGATGFGGPQPPSLSPYSSRPPAPYMPPVVPPRPMNGAATGALVCALLTPVTFGLTGIPAVILGNRARAEIRRTGERGEGAAVTGVAVGWLALTVLMLIFVLAMVGSALSK
ncbi:DUF1707 and DUF4190 domain-containing protein [Streptomyces sp. ODS28]|uniref:DUF1707 and DUF4190 domain-containing protein n=1 Tax=Streptomyces sp. ODS28 TaxID=3136688 RepID=UPI0031E61D1A